MKPLPSASRFARRVVEERVAARVEVAPLRQHVRRRGCASAPTATTPSPMAKVRARPAGAAASATAAASARATRRADEHRQSACPSSSMRSSWRRVSGAMSSARPEHEQVVVDLRHEILRAGAGELARRPARASRSNSSTCSGRSGIERRDLGEARARAASSMSRTGREVHLEVGRPRVDHVVARGAGAE